MYVLNVSKECVSSIKTGMHPDLKKNIRIIRAMQA